MSLHVHVWDAAGGMGCGACGEYRPEVYLCSWEGCEYRMYDAAHGDIEDHWREHLSAERSAGAAPLDEIRAALTDEDEIGHGEAFDGVRGTGECAYCDDEWPCRTQRGIDRLLERTDR